MEIIFHDFNTGHVFCYLTESPVRFEGPSLRTSLELPRVVGIKILEAKYGKCLNIGHLQVWFLKGPNSFKTFWYDNGVQNGIQNV